MSQVREGKDLLQDVTETCDVCIVGSGAGGAVLAAKLAAAGLDVVILEAGGLYTSADFDLDEGKAYAAMYQECGAQSTDDLAITLLQGRSVGGSTTINWTTCYRTPERILAHWRDVHGLRGLEHTSLDPLWDAIESRLNITEWPEALVNANNETILRGGRALGWEVHTVKRNVKGCANSGYCGVGCPVNGKQAMHLTYLPDALAGGARLLADTAAVQITMAGRKATGVDALVLDRHTNKPTGVKVRIDAKVVVSSAGALHSPALLLRSGVDEGGQVGTRTFIHPVCAVTGEYEERIRPWAGAPQSAACHEFIDRGPDAIGFFIEAPPMQPMLASTGPKSFGADMAEFMTRLDHASTTIALAVDGLHPEDPGGTVSLKSDGRPQLQYPTRPLLIEALKAAHQRMAEMHVAAGAQRLTTLHTDPVVMQPSDLSRLDQARYGAHEHAIFSAHLMGGCPLGRVLDERHRVLSTDNLFVVDGSALPTALGVNPSQTIYGLAARAAVFIAEAAG
jgi:choline dehydrogenase-like flavoprotein